MVGLSASMAGISGTSCFYLAKLPGETGVVSRHQKYRIGDGEIGWPGSAFRFYTSRNTGA